MKPVFRNTFLFLYVSVLLLLFSGTSAFVAYASEQETKRVFIINSFNRGYTWTDNMLRGIDDVFNSSGIKIETYISFMDMKRVPPTPQNFFLLKELIKEGYKDTRFDAVLACDNDALEFVRKYRDELFPGVPVVFSSINDYNEKMLDGRKDITGTSENTDYAGTIRVALKLRPATKNIVVVVDNTTTGKAHRSAVEKIQLEFSQHLSFTYISLADMTMDELALKLSALDNSSIVLLLQHFVDKNGVFYTIQQSTPLLTKCSPVPVFVLSDIRVGLGALGGVVVSGYHHGEAAAKMVVEILNGTDVKTIPVMLKSPNKNMFDYTVMQRFKIAEKNLPPESIVINKPVSPLEKYKPHMLAILCVFILLCALLLFLLLEVRRRKKIEKILMESRETLSKLANEQRIILNCRPIGVCFLKDRTIQYSNPAFESIFGYEAGTTKGLNTSVFYVDKETFDNVGKQAYTTIANGGIFSVEVKMKKKDGSQFLCSISGQAVNQGNPEDGAIWMLLDITERKKSEEKLKQFKTIFDVANFGTAIADMNGILTYVNDCYAAAHGFQAQELLGQPLRILHSAQQMEQVEPLLRQLLSEGFFNPQEVGHVRKDGTEFPMLMTGMMVKDEKGAPQSFTATAIDLTESKMLEAQLRQAQKMESVGRLAGGVAHDFNNMLGVILGHVELALLQANPDEPLYYDLEEIRMAAERSANLIRQLLAFARKQTVAPKILNLNETVQGMLNMLQRLISEDVELIWKPEENLWTIKMDPSQIDQILANLCVNARDAISDVGLISIETGNCIFDDNFYDDNPDFAPGEYVRLSVSDNGCGMDKETLSHIFEPFFTTKNIGRGTGLGLATVYGIVKQNKGFINVYSEPQNGTSFTIYLPRYSGKSEQKTAEGPKYTITHGQETILLVEDEPTLLTLVTQMLEKQGYNVLAADSPNEAIHLTREYEGEIHLIITDVVMPEMNGRDLAITLLSVYPSLRCLYMSGYTADVIANHGALDEGVYFIQKPFSIKALAVKVREVLDGK